MVEVLRLLVGADPVVTGSGNPEVGAISSLEIPHIRVSVPGFPPDLETLLLVADAGAPIIGPHIPGQWRVMVHDARLDDLSDSLARFPRAISPRFNCRN